MKKSSLAVIVCTVTGILVLRAIAREVYLTDMSPPSARPILTGARDMTRGETNATVAAPDDRALLQEPPLGTEPPELWAATREAGLRNGILGHPLAYRLTLKRLQCEDYVCTIDADQPAGESILQEILGTLNSAPWWRFRSQGGEGSSSQGDAFEHTRITLKEQPEENVNHSEQIEHLIERARHTVPGNLEDYANMIEMTPGDPAIAENARAQLEQAILAHPNVALVEIEAITCNNSGCVVRLTGDMQNQDVRQMVTRTHVALPLGPDEAVSRQSSTSGGQIISVFYAGDLNAAFTSWAEAGGLTSEEIARRRAQQIAGYQKLLAAEAGVQPGATSP